MFQTKKCRSRMYYWQLEKYKGQKTRYKCPACNKPHEYTRYINADGEYAPYEYGVCNRVEKCGYSRYPKKEDNASMRVIKPFKERLPDIIESNIYLDKYKDIDQDNNLFSFLAKYYPKENILKVFNDYFVRTEGNNIVFPYANKKALLRYVKIIGYKENGHRTKYIFAPFTGNYKACLFGLHLYQDDKQICIVESEKTALICALEYPQYIWMSTGGLQNLARLKDINKADVFPDKGKAFEIWSKKIKPPFTINNTLEELEYLKNGDDLADYILHHKKTMN